MLTRAGMEIGVASTKAFTTQITALSMLVIALAKTHGADVERERGLVTAPGGAARAHRKDAAARRPIRELARRFVDKHHGIVPWVAVPWLPSHWKAR